LLGLDIPAAAADGGSFSRNPSSGPPGTTITVASIDPCTAPPPAPADPKTGDDDIFVRIFLVPPDNGRLLGTIDADDGSGHWSGTVKVPDDVAPETYQLRVACGRVVTTPGTPATEAPEDYYEYARQVFTVTAPAPASTTTTTSQPSTSPPSTSQPSSPSTTAKPPLISTGRVNPAVGLRPFQQVTITGGGYVPNTPLKVTFFSAPIDMESITSRANGSYNAKVRIPIGAPPGQHGIVVSGPAPNGRTRNTRAALTVRDMECTDFPTAEGPQNILAADPSDPHGLDPDHDGVACETLQRVSNVLATSGSWTLHLLGLGLVTLVLGASYLIASRTIFDDEWPVF
jgi:hypothetical protein